MRLDLYLVEKGLAPSRTKAQELIRAGVVFLMVGGKKTNLTKPSFDVGGDAHIHIEDSDVLRWVSRAGRKLEGALDRLGLDLDGMLALDVGQSTGGFSQVLAHRGCQRVVGIDVGHGQIDPLVADLHNVTVFEGCLAKDFPALAAAENLPRFQFVTFDVSFISLTQVLPTLKPVMDESVILLGLVKPQFELSRDRLNKAGVVKSENDYEVVQQRIQSLMQSMGFQMTDYFESPILGGDGNKEFFVFAKTAQS